jgi:hypothetical protein
MDPDAHRDDWQIQGSDRGSEAARVRFCVIPTDVGISFDEQSVGLASLAAEFVELLVTDRLRHRTFDGLP